MIEQLRVRSLGANTSGSSPMADERSRPRLGCWDVEDPIASALAWSGAGSAKTRDHLPASADGRRVAALEGRGPGCAVAETLDGRDAPAVARGRSGIGASGSPATAGSSDGRIARGRAGPLERPSGTCETGRERARSSERAHAGRASSIGFSPDGRLLAVEFTASTDASVYDLRHRRRPDDPPGRGRSLPARAAGVLARRPLLRLERPEARTVLKPMRICAARPVA